MIALARDGQLEADVETVALEDTVDAYRRLRDGKVTGRAVVVPNGGATARASYSSGSKMRTTPVSSPPT